MPKRKQYTIELKKKIIQEVEEWVKSSEVGRKYDISHTLVSKWYKDRYNITGMAIIANDNEYSQQFYDNINKLHDYCTDKIILRQKSIVGYLN